MVNPFAHKNSFDSENFDGLSLDGVDLSDREFYKCVFRNSKLSETRWLRSRLDECLFDGCDLTRADPRMLSLRDVTFKSCKLMGIDFTHIAKYPNMSFDQCNLHYVSLVSIPLRKARFEQCAILDANFFEVDLTDAKFDDCQFAGTRFERCDLRRVRFRRAQDLFLDPARNLVKGAEVPLETAILLATSYGMRVSGFSTKDKW